MSEWWREAMTLALTIIFIVVVCGGGAILMSAYIAMLTKDDGGW